MTRRWEDIGLRGDDHWGLILDGEIVLYVGTDRRVELVYRSGSGSQTEQNVYHLILWRGYACWIDERKGYLLPV
jgi:hypothetical protein